MAYLTQTKIDDYRQVTFRLESNRRVRTKGGAINFVNERGFIFFWPIRDVVLPNLWSAVAGSRPVASAHDDPGHITWGWKDDLLEKKVWYYARVLRNRNTMISLEMLPYFYALSPNYGDPDQDIDEQYEQGLITQETKLVYEALKNEGRLDTLSLRRAAHLSNPESTSRFNKALETLQIEFRVLPVGIAQAGAWRYAYIYDLTHRYFPDLSNTAHAISEHEARRQLLVSYIESVGAAFERDIKKIFAWRLEDIARSVTKLADSGFLVEGVEIEKSKQPSIALATLL